MRRNSPGPPALRADGGDLVSALCGITELATMRAFLAEILSPAERTDLGLRWRLMQLLHQGASQRAIARELGISLCKITRGSRVLKQPHAVSRRILEHS